MAKRTRIKNCKQLRFVITGSFLYGNLGSAAMVVILVEQLRVRFPNCIITLASKYPEKDKEELCKYFNDCSGLLVTSTKQLKATFFGLPTVAIYTLLNKFGIRINFLLRVSDLKSFSDADYVIDIGGITFSEERGLSGLIINTTWVLIPSLFKKPIIKLAQAFGPLNKKWFIAFSSLILNRVSLIISRGHLSSAELAKLQLRKPCKDCSDLAFLMKPEQTKNNEKLKKKVSSIAITPSSVLYKKMGPSKYVNLFKQLIFDLNDEYPNYSIRLISHSYKQGKTLNNNDYPVCKAIWDGLPEYLREKTVLIYGDYTASEMKYIISQSELLIACRFHSMIAALSTEVPTVVLGWSHKYQEIMDIFGLETVVNYKSYEYEHLWSAVKDAIANNLKYKAILREKNSYCKASAMENFTLLEEFVLKNGAN